MTDWWDGFFTKPLFVFVLCPQRKGLKTKGKNHKKGHLRFKTAPGGSTGSLKEDKWLKHAIPSGNFWV